MNSVDCVAKTIDAMDELRIPFMVVGSFSSNVYGIPRSTKDADFVIQIEHHQIADLAAKVAADLVLEPEIVFESVTGTTAYHFKHRSSPFKIELCCTGVELSPHSRNRSVTVGPV